MPPREFLPEADLECIFSFGGKREERVIAEQRQRNAGGEGSPRSAEEGIPLVEPSSDALNSIILRGLRINDRGRGQNQTG